MSRAVRPFSSALFVLALLVGVPDAAPAAAPKDAAPETVTVIVKKTALRRDRQFFAASVGSAAYGERLAVVGREGDWVQVSGSGATGWIHASAVTVKKVKVEEKLEAPVPAGFQEGEDEDVALAGKGFNPQVESEYRKKNPGANYAAVDRMEKVAASEKAVADFTREGHLEVRGGGR